MQRVNGRTLPLMLIDPVYLRLSSKARPSQPPCWLAGSPFYSHNDIESGEASLCQTDNPQNCFTFCVNIHLSPHIDIAGLTTDTGLTQQFHLTASHQVRLEVSEYAGQAYGQHPYGHISSPYGYTNYYKASVRSVCIFPNSRGSFGWLSLGFRQVCSTQLA